MGDGSLVVSKFGPNPCEELSESEVEDGFGIAVISCNALCKAICRTMHPR